MTNRITKRKWVFLFASLVIGASLISAVVFSAKRQQPKRQVEQQPRVNYMPPVISKVKNLEIVRAWMVDPGTAAAGIEVEIKNNSNKDVMAVDLVCGEGGITRNGLTDEEHPVVVIRANDTTTMRINFSEMTFGAPLVVSAVTYADGTEEGEDSSLKLMHAVREQRAQLKAQKQHSPEGAPTP